MIERNIIFDMDGTLFNTEKVLVAALEKTFDCLRDLKEWEGETPVDKYLSIMGVPLPEVWKTLLPMHEEHLHEKVNRIFHIHLFREIRSGKGELYPGVLRLLKTLAERHNIFIASNGLNSYLLEIVRYFNLNPYISGIYSIEICPSGKKEDLVKIIMEENNLTSAVMVGDRSSDINAGHVNNLYTVGCSWGFASPGELDGADLVIDSAERLLDFLKMQGAAGS